jgi:hypothetical protein
MKEKYVLKVLLFLFLMRESFKQDTKFMEYYDCCCSGIGIEKLAERFLFEGIRMEAGR